MSGILKSWLGRIALVGGPEENNLACDIERPLADDRIVNLVGKTQLADVFEILKKSKLLVGGDSVAIHMASMTQTPTLNLSLANVSFWETGPLARGSRVVKAADAESLPSDIVVGHILQMLGLRESGNLGLYYSRTQDQVEKFVAVDGEDRSGIS